MQIQITDASLLKELNLVQLMGLKEMLGREGGVDNRLAAVTVGEEIAERVTARNDVKLFRKYIRGAGLVAEEEKALDTLRDPQGGYAVPQPALAEYLRQVQPSALWEAVTKRYPTRGNQYPVAVSQTALQVVRRAETETHQVTEAHEINREGIPVHDLVATPKISTALLDGDPSYPDQTLFPEFLDAAMAQEAKEILVGNGVGQCEGILTCPGITTVNSGNASALTADGIIGLETAVPEPYRSRAKWIMARSTLDAVRKLKGTDGQYMFPQVGETETLRGRHRPARVRRFVALLPHHSASAGRSP